eukprot:4732706-Ditylum_brightwellii.AAC.1
MSIAETHQIQSGLVMAGVIKVKCTRMRRVVMMVEIVAPKLARILFMIVLNLLIARIYLLYLHSCNPPNPEWIGDGWCDPGEVYNNEACGYDGGDCCAKTCAHTIYDCSQPFDCKDPSTLSDSCNAKLE